MLHAPAAATGVFSGTVTLSGLTASTALALDASKNIVSVGNTGTGNNVLSISPIFTGTITAAAMNISGTINLSGLTASNVLVIDSSKNIVGLGFTGAISSVVMSSGPTLTGTTLMAALTLSGLLVTVLSATGGAGFRLPHGATPTAPVDGDMWSTTAGLFIRVNGVTKTVTLI